MAGFWDRYDLLEIVEAFAADNGEIASEEELSEMFDRDILPDVIAHYGEDDQPAINEAFNDWTDMLCKDGVLHPEQYNRYCYVGKLAD